MKFDNLMKVRIEHRNWRNQLLKVAADVFGIREGNKPLSKVLSDKPREVLF